MSDATISAATKVVSGAEAGPADYVSLLKPRVMSLVIFTALVGMTTAYAAALGSSGVASVLDPRLAAVSLVAIALGAGASGALNMWWDADIDAVMERTARRPIPLGHVDRDTAGVFGLILSTIAVTLLWLASSVLAASLLAFTIFFYVVIYSMWLKRRTPQNIVIGGAAGALPPVVAWAAVTGEAPLAAWVLFAVIFLWTPPHFWALALFRSGDYARAGVPMMPVARGEASTRRQIFAYAVVVALAGFTPYLLGVAGPVYAVVAGLLGAWFVILSWRVLRNETPARGPEKRLFGFSIVYLFGLFSALLGESVFALLQGASS